MELQLEIPQYNKEETPAADEEAGVCILDYSVDFTIE
jgi:hypothetical protein